MPSTTEIAKVHVVNVKDGKGSGSDGFFCLIVLCIIAFFLFSIAANLIQLKAAYIAVNGEVAEDAAYTAKKELFEVLGIDP